MSECPYCRERAPEPISGETEDGVFAELGFENDFSHDPYNRLYYGLLGAVSGTEPPMAGRSRELVMVARYDGGYVSGTARVPVSFCPFCGRDLRMKE